MLFSPFWAGAIALAIHNGAYITEIFRGSIQSVDRGQLEAARSLGMPYPLAMRRIILPQAFRLSLPPLGNQFIIGLKDSSLVAYVGMSELWGSGLSIAAGNFQQLDTYIIVGAYYLVLVLLFTYFVNLLENDYNEKKLTPSKSIKRTKGSFYKKSKPEMACFFTAKYINFTDLFLILSFLLYVPHDMKYYEGLSHFLKNRRNALYADQLIHFRDNTRGVFQSAANAFVIGIS